VCTTQSSLHHLCSAYIDSFFGGSIIALDQKQQALRSLVGAEMAKRAAERAENDARKSLEAAVEGLRQQLAFFTRATEICGRIAAVAQPNGKTAAAKRKEAVQKGFTEMTANENPIAFTDAIRAQIQNLGEVIKIWEPNSQPSTDQLMQAILAVAQEYERAWKTHMPSSVCLVRERNNNCEMR